ncbi:asparagine synthetase domain-containing protein CG17486 [Rhagoletis pomonella]|uniref:asparagine synthetase domain-containing protein CG17486 n=1 Tax=Rhagoletis pomonella TaxID=28610 RepID=UPI001780B447|nr:asparagine synthetase domain-containing protein CG17486 [Rhagoletis pomonella]
MCGIACGINCEIKTNEKLLKFLKRRGPNFFSCLKIKVENIFLEFGSSVLWQQGDNLCSQPVRQGNFLILFNGDIFNIPDKQSAESDTEWLAKKISGCTNETDVCHLIQSLQGPFSLIIFHIYSRSLYICRDYLGRNSLIIEKEAELFRFSSTSCNYNSRKCALELPPLGLYVFDPIFPTVWKLFPWKQTTDALSIEIKTLNNIFGLTISVEEHMKPDWLKVQLGLRVVVVGSGADELFGGYTRHRNAFCRFEGNEDEKLMNLHRELEKDWNRIWARNLGRDDRVVADNGKTLRAPFIEEKLAQYVRSLSPSQLCCFLLKEGIGDKLFLRLFGFQLGLKDVSKLKKRAIQFGSKIANKKLNATDRSVYL